VVLLENVEVSLCSWTRWDSTVGIVAKDMSELVSVERKRYRERSCTAFVHLRLVLLDEPLVSAVCIFATIDVARRRRWSPTRHGSWSQLCKMMMMVASRAPQLYKSRHLHVIELLGKMRTVLFTPGDFICLRLEKQCRGKGKERTRGSSRGTAGRCLSREKGEVS
jgi:hypothetical protein